MPRYPRLPNCIFRETFESQQSVAQNGGVVTGTPVINNGVTLDGSAQYITYTKNLYGIKKASTGKSLGTVTVPNGVATSTITTGLHTITVTTATAFNGVNVVVGKVGVNYGTGTLGSDIVSGKGVMLGARWNSAASPHQFLTSGKRILDFSIYPFALTPVQVKMLSDNINKTKNV